MRQKNLNINTIEIGDFPNSEAIESELKRVKYHKSFHQALVSTLCAFVIIAAVAMILSTQMISISTIFGPSMYPTLEDEDVVLSFRTENVKPGNLISFFHKDKMLVARVIAVGGDWVNIDEDGTVFVNEEPLEEPYVAVKDQGMHDISFPFQVPEERLFVLSDQRSYSADSRMKEIGCIAYDQVFSKILFTIWPFSRFGFIQ